MSLSEGLVDKRRVDDSAEAKKMVACCHIHTAEQHVGKAAVRHDTTTVVTLLLYAGGNRIQQQQF